MGTLIKVWNFFDGWKTYIAGASLLLIGLGSLFTEMGHCIEDVNTIVNGWEICVQNVSTSWNGLMEALMGLGFIGAKHAITKATATRG